MQSRVIYEDRYLLVVHKPAGLATQTARVGQQDVVSELRNYLSGQRRERKGGSERYLGIVHRLDQPVEGLLVFAKDRASAAGLSAQLGEGTLNKRYYAAVSGGPAEDEGKLTDWLVRDPQNQTAKVVPDGQPYRGQEPKKAVLQYRVLKKVLEPVPYSLLDVHIDTGRFHQIRVQLAHAGMPVLGDHKYGDFASGERSRELGIRNVALYAYFLEFTHPGSGKRMEFRIEPEFFQNST